MIEFFITSGFLNAFAFTAIFFFVLLSSPQKKLNQLYALFSLAMACWGISYVFWLQSDNYGSAMLWTQVINFCAIFIPVFFSHWLLVVLGVEGQKKFKGFLFFSYAASFFFAAFAFTPYYIKDLTQRMFFDYWPVPGVLHPYFLAICWGFIIWYPIWELFKAYRANSGYRREQLKYLLFTVAIGFGGGMTNFLLWYGVPALPWANISMSLWGAAFLYIIFHYRFMDFNLILGRVGIYLASLISIAAYAWTYSNFRDAVQGKSYLLLMDMLFAFGAVSLFNFLFNFFEEVAGKYFYYTYYNLKQKAALLSEKMNQMIDLEELSDFVVESLAQAMAIKRSSVILRSVNQKNFYIEEISGFSPGEIESFLEKQKEFINFWFKKTKKILVSEGITLTVDRLEAGPEKQTIKEKMFVLKEDLEKIGVTALMPFFVEEELIGFIIFGERVGGKFYTFQELEVLESFAIQASVALNNSLAYDQLAKNKAELEKFNKLVIDRELKMMDLKNKIKELEAKLAQKA